MIKSKRFVRRFESRVESAISGVARDYAEDYIADEDDFTSQLLARIKEKLDGWRHGRITVSTTILDPTFGDAVRERVSMDVRKLRSRGRGGVEEGEFGADILLALDVDIPGYRASKGIMIQAKRLDVGDSMDPVDWERLGGQADKMEKYTKESYVWFYDAGGVRSLKAQTLSGLSTQRPDDLYTTGGGRFLGELVQCKHGDDRIRSSSSETLEVLRREYRSRTAAGISVQESSPWRW